MPWKTQGLAWLQDLVHWFSQWIAYCPVVILATARNGHEREDAQDRFLPKFLFSLMIQVATATISVVGGSWLTLQIVSYRMDLAEQNIKSLQARGGKLEDRVAMAESELAVVRERHRIEELMRNSINGKLR